MAKIKVLLEGYHTKLDNKLNISSTITLIKSKQKNIIVDTGHLWSKEQIISGLKEEGLTPEDIDTVVFTHVHLDHVANLYLFKNADLYLKFISNYPGQHHNFQDNFVERMDIVDGTKLTDEVEFLLTPGHTTDSISLVVDTAEGKVVVCGDAIASEDFTDMSKEPDHMLIFDIQKYNSSRLRILGLADYIVPGHGKMFKVKK